MGSWRTYLLICLITLVSFEIGYRIVNRETLLPINFLDRDANLLRSAYPAEYDKTLGWIPKPGTKNKTNLWNSTINIEDHGVRSNGNHPPSQSPFKILTVGDSFVFGDQVSDHQTWPSELERISGLKVINGGVFGYGIDQIVMRAETLIPVLEPKAFILSFTPDDVARSELSLRTGVQKPYFRLDSNGSPELKNVPVPLSHSVRRLGFVRRVLGYSFYVHQFMGRLYRSYWYSGTSDSWGYVIEHHQGLEVSCALMRRLKTLIDHEEIPALIVAQYGPKDPLNEIERNQKFIACMRDMGFEVLDQYKDLYKIREMDPERFQSFYSGHMTEVGNFWVARNIWERIQVLWKNKF